MAKQGQHHHDANDPDVARGRNSPSKSTPITTGTPKKRETYEEQAREHRNTNPRPQWRSTSGTNRRRAGWTLPTVRRPIAEAAADPTKTSRRVDISDRY